MDLLLEIGKCLQEGDEEKIVVLTKEALAHAIGAKKILDAGLIANMNKVGELFRDREIFLPDVLLSARAMHASIAVLRPLLLTEKNSSRGKVVLGTVQGDLHDIGKNLVGIMLQGAGFEVIDIGNDVPPERFVDVAVEQGANVIGMSAMLTTTMPAMQQTVAMLKAKKTAVAVKTIIGGAPVSEAYSKEIGADAYAYDAAQAVEQVKKMVESLP